jgi:transposase
MIIDWKTVRIFLHPGPTDMRKHINGLARMAEESGHDPFSENLYLYCGRDRKRLSALYWNKNGFCLWTKRLERDKFPWPESGEEVREISFRDLRMLLAGIDFFHAHRRLSYSSVS